MKKLIITIALFVPVVAFAMTLDFTDHSSQYTDAPFSKGEAAGISLLTSIHAVSGNPDGSFAPGRNLNRAEFTKIAMLSNPDIVVNASDAVSCFPDVPASAWFSKFVCAAKRLGYVGGNPNGNFDPNRNVNYAEALKILGNIFGLQGENVSGAPWYARFEAAANVARVNLLWRPNPAAFLTRGDMARLTAAYVAYSNDQLDAYRAAERGQTWSPPSSSSSSSSSSISSTSSSSLTSSGSSVSSSSSSSSLVAVAGFPAQSHFLVAGQRTLPIASATFFADLEPTIVQRAEVRLDHKVTGVDSMVLLDSSGYEIGQLTLDKLFDPTEKTYRGSFTDKHYVIPKSTQKMLGVEAIMKPRNQGGTSEELVYVQSFKLIVLGEWSQNSYNSGTDTGPYPRHQTSMGRIIGVTNGQEATGILPIGEGQQLASFTIAGSAVEGITLKAENLEFQVNALPYVTVRHWLLGIADSNELVPCSINGSIVSCLNLSDAMGTIPETRTFRLFGDVSLASGATEKSLQISLNQAGDLSTFGAIRWTDGSGHFNWVELEQPLARSTLWK